MKGQETEQGLQISASLPLPLHHAATTGLASLGKEVLFPLSVAISLKPITVAGAEKTL